MSFFKKINSLALSLKPPLIPCLSPAPHSSPQRKHHYQPEVCPLVSRRTHSILIFLQHDRPGERDRLEGTLFVPYSFFPLLFLLKESLKNRFPATLTHCTLTEFSTWSSSYPKPTGPGRGCPSEESKWLGRRPFPACSQVPQRPELLQNNMGGVGSTGIFPTCFGDNILGWKMAVGSFFWDRQSQT